MSVSSGFSDKSKSMGLTYCATHNFLGEETEVQKEQKLPKATQIVSDRAG